MMKMKMSCSLENISHFHFYMMVTPKKEEYSRNTTIITAILLGYTCEDEKKSMKNCLDKL